MATPGPEGMVPRLGMVALRWDVAWCGREEASMATPRDHPSTIGAAGAGTFPLGGDLTVARLGFGAMRLPQDHGQARALLRRAVELGVRLIDTAEFYGPGTSERLIAEALHPYPDGLVIATKGLTHPPGQWGQRGHPGRLREAVEGSLRRLRLERIDLYQLARIDPGVPAEDQFGVLAELREQGKVRHVGLSEVGVDQVEAARRIVPVASVQNRYSLADRAWERALDHCEREGIAFLPWFPLGAGRLAEARGALVEVARRHDATPAQVALAWLLQRSPVMVPIPGTSSVAHLEENLAASALRLDDDELQLLGSA
jgi:pyridoxine 4-dehydrogenase